MFLVGMTQDKQKALLLLWSLEQNKFQKYKKRKITNKNTKPKTKKLKEMLLELTIIHKIFETNSSFHAK